MGNPIIKNKVDQSYMWGENHWEDMMKNYHHHQ